MRDLTVGRALSRAAVAGLLVVTSGCAGVRGPPEPRVTLPPDSLRRLEEALRDVRPAYATQREALRAGVYRERPERAPARAGGAGWVVQIGAFRDAAIAEDEALRAERLFPHLEVAVERGEDHLLRVVLGRWSTLAEASARLPEVRARYPDAWPRELAPR